MAHCESREEENSAQTGIDVASSPAESDVRAYNWIAGHST